MAQGTYAAIPAYQYTDQNGLVAVGYKLFTYTAGTSTKATTWTDVAMTVANANPIIIPADGRPSIVVVPGTGYKLVMALPNDGDPPSSPVWTRDNVLGIGLSVADSDVTGTAGETIAQGDACYLSDGQGAKTAGRWYRTNAITTYSGAAAYMVGFANTALTVGVSGSFRIAGRVTGLSALTVGGVHYLSSSVAGAILAAAPTGPRAIGVADSSTSIIVSPWVEMANPGPWFGGPPIFRQGTSATHDATTNGKILFDHTQKSGATGAGTDCLSGTIAGNSIAAAGKMIRLVARGTFAANANNKTMTFTWGGTVFFTFPTLASNNYVWKLEIEMFRTTAGNAHVQHYKLAIAPTAGGGVGAVYEDRSAGSKDLTADQTIKITIISGTASGDITFDAGYVEVIG